MKIHRYGLGLMALLFLAPVYWQSANAGFRSLEALAAPVSDPWPRWRAADPASTAKIDFTAWDRLLQRYLIPEPGGINLFRYGAVTAPDRAALDGLVAKFASLPISTYNRAQQMAYWINLYNALTVKVILDNGPVSTIQDIDISPGFFSSGPWDKKLLVIEGEAVSLNDMEHRILRPLWGDARVHYVLNCASLGCPNLGDRAYQAENMDIRLDAAAREFINSPGGVRFEDGNLIVSSIYDWFAVDFGGDEANVLKHLEKYAGPALSAKLRKHSRIDDTAYDWNLNGVN